MCLAAAQLAGEPAGGPSVCEADPGEVGPSSLATTNRINDGLIRVCPTLIRGRAELIEPAHYGR